MYWRKITEDRKMNFAAKPVLTLWLCILYVLHLQWSSELQATKQCRKEVTAFQGAKLEEISLKALTI